MTMNPNKILTGTVAGLICVGLAACSKPEEKTTVVVPAPTQAQPTTTIVVPAAPQSQPATTVVMPQPTAPSTTTVVVPKSSPSSSTTTVVKPSASNMTRINANGFSPAWEANVEGDSVTFLVPDLKEPGMKRTIQVQRSIYSKGVTYNGKDGAIPVSFDVKNMECIKTGEKREFTATLAYGGSVYRGCADGMQ